MDEVKTGVDELMELLRRQERISIPDAAKQLHQPERIVQNWVDFLVEEKLLGIEYKFTTPYIYINAPEKASVIAAKAETMEDIKRDFSQRAKEKGMPADKLKPLWQNHLSAAVDSRADFFHQECAKRSLTKVDELFKRYKEKLLAEHELGVA